MQVELSKDLARHLRRGHPWVFRKALIHPPKAPAGEVVDVVSGGRFVARGLLVDDLGAIVLGPLESFDGQPKAYDRL